MVPAQALVPAENWERAFVKSGVGGSSHTHLPPQGGLLKGVSQPARQAEGPGVNCSERGIVGERRQGGPSGREAQDWRNKEPGGEGSSWT